MGSVTGESEKIIRIIGSYLPIILYFYSGFPNIVKPKRQRVYFFKQIPMNIRKNIAVSETGFIFNPLTGDSFSVNETGLFVLQKLKEEENEETILKAFQEEFELDRNTAEIDLNDFLSLLKSYQLTTYEEA